MIGNNSLIVNQATMIEIAQFWIDSKFAESAPKVTRVDKTPDAFQKETFTIELTNRDKDKQ